MSTSARFRRSLRTAVLTLLMLLSLLSVAAAAPQTLTIYGGVGSPGQVDPYTEYSLDNGQSWHQAYLTGWHPWGFVSGTNSWVNCNPSPFVCLNQTVLYRVRFNVPAGFSNPSLVFDVKADNAATIWLNGTYVTYIVGGGGTTSDATIASAVTVGMNEIRLRVDDWGGWAGFNYKVTIKMDAPTPLSTLPGGQPADTAPPVLSVPAPLTLECPGPAGVLSSDPRVQSWLAQASATDNVDGAVAVTHNLSGACSIGTTTVTFAAEDAAGNAASQQSSITVVDTTAPVISAASVTPNSIWSPNHKLVSAAVTVSAADACDPNAACQIVAVTSNQPVNGRGDGNTAVDWVITGPLTVDLQAERAGSAGDRVYTIQLACMDSSGNASTTSVTVTVPRDQRKK